MKYSQFWQKPFKVFEKQMKLMRTTISGQLLCFLIVIDLLKTINSFSAANNNKMFHYKLLLFLVIRKSSFVFHVSQRERKKIKRGCKK